MKKKQESNSVAYLFGLNSVAMGNVVVGNTGIFSMQNMKKQSKDGKVGKNDIDNSSPSCYLYFLSVASIEKLLKSLTELKKKMKENEKSLAELKKKMKKNGELRSFSISVKKPNKIVVKNKKTR
jgi:hypothetical protein